VTCWPRSFHC